MPSTLSILINVFPPHERPKAIAIWASVTGAAGALGPIASGLLLAHFWWGSVFLINIPLIVVALIGGRFFVPKSRDHEQARLDPVGAALSTIGIVALVYGLIEAPSSGWLSGATVGSFAIAAGVLAAFVLWELRVEHPTLDVRYFRNPAFAIGTGGMILVFVAMYGVMFLVTQYFQLVLGYSALSTAVRFVPIAFIMIAVAPQTPRLTARFGAHRTVGVGMLLVAGGLLAFLGLGLHTSYAYVVACLVPIVGGMALSISPMTTAIMSAVPPRRAGAGSAMNDTTRELGPRSASPCWEARPPRGMRAGCGHRCVPWPLRPERTAQSSLAGAPCRWPAPCPVARAALATRADQALRRWVPPGGPGGGGPGSDVGGHRGLLPAPPGHPPRRRAHSAGGGARRNGARIPGGRSRAGRGVVETMPFQRLVALPDLPGHQVACHGELFLGEFGNQLVEGPAHLRVGEGGAVGKVSCLSKERVQLQIQGCGESRQALSWNTDFPSFPAEDRPLGDAQFRRQFVLSYAQLFSPFLQAATQFSHFEDPSTIEGYGAWTCRRCKSCGNYINVI